MNRGWKIVRLVPQDVFQFLGGANLNGLRKVRIHSISLNEDGGGGGGEIPSNPVDGGGGRVADNEPDIV